jgi:hypothetical protein
MIAPAVTKTIACTRESQTPIFAAYQATACATCVEDLWPEYGAEFFKNLKPNGELRNLTAARVGGPVQSRE